MAGGAIEGSLFKDVTFFIGQRVPQRSTYIEKVRLNGGVLVPLERQAKVQIADHLRAAQNPPGTTSYEWIDKSIEAGELLDPAAYPASPVVRAPRPAGALPPGKSSRTSYNAADDLELWNHVQAAKRQGRSIKGNEIYMQLEKTNPRHPWQSWRDRWVKYLSTRAPPAGAVPDGSVAPSSSPPRITTTQTRNESSITSRMNIPHNNQGRLGHSPDVAVVIPVSTAQSPHTAQTPKAVRSHEEVKQTPFSTQDHDLLMENAPNIEEMSVRKYDRGWTAFAHTHTHHTAGQWKQYYEEFVRPEYRKNAPDTTDEEQEDGDEADEVQNAAMPSSSPFINIMKVKTPSKTGKRRLSSSPHAHMEIEASRKRQRLSSPSTSEVGNDVAASLNAQYAFSAGLRDGTDHDFASRPGAEQAHPADSVDGEAIETTGNRAQDSIHAQDSQQSWQGLSPVQEIEERGDVQEVDAIPEGDEENYYVDENGAHKVPPHHEANEANTHLTIPVLRDLTQDFVMSQATQNSMEEWHDAREGGSNQEPGTDAAVISPQRPGLWAQVAQLDQLNGEEDEEDAEMDDDQDHEEANLAAQFARQTSREDSLQDEEEELQVEDGDLDGLNGGEAFPIHEDSRSPEKLSVEPITFDSDQLLPPDSSIADDEDPPSPTPRKRKAQRTYAAPSAEDAESDIEDYTIIAPPIDSDIGHFNPTTDEPLPSIEDYVDTQAVLQADTQALDADFPLPAQSQNVSQFSQWVKEQRLQVPNSDIAPSSPGTAAVVPSSMGRSRAIAALAARKARETSTLFVPSDDDESLAGLPRNITAVPSTSKAVSQPTSSRQPAASPKEISKRPATTQAAGQVRTSQPPVRSRPAVFRRPDAPRPVQDDSALPNIGDDDDIHEIPTPKATAPAASTLKSTAPGPSSSTSPANSVEAWIAHHVARGKTKDELQYCLQRTSYDCPLALRVLHSLGRGRGVPKGFKGIWTEEDDEFMLQIIQHGEKGYHRLPKVELVGLHGIEAWRDRMKDLRAWNE